MKIRWWLTIGVAALAARMACTSDEPTRLRIATFNIEHFPKDSRQIAGAFDEIASLDAGIVAVQEITDTEVFAHAARERLGRQWDFVYEDMSPRATNHVVHHLGVAFDSYAWSLVSTDLHDGTRLEGKYKPTLEVRLEPRGGGAIVRILVVHLKAGGDSQPIRARQHAALANIVRDAMETGERVVVLGDFNSTDDVGDRNDIAALASSTGITWATEQLACSAFWDRNDGCPRSRLDHVMTWTPAKRVEAMGACATEGCDWQDSCPIYREHVSDHCPVVVEF